MQEHAGLKDEFITPLRPFNYIYWTRTFILLNNEFMKKQYSSLRKFRNLLFLFLIILFGCVKVDEEAFSNVRHENGKTLIIDRTGDKWDIAQAETLGFKPENFQYGIGKNGLMRTPDQKFLSRLCNRHFYHLNWKQPPIPAHTLSWIIEPGISPPSTASINVPENQVNAMSYGIGITA